MKVLGLLFAIVTIVIGYCVYNPVVVDSVDSTDTSSTDNCKGPFGVDSQKIVDHSGMGYEIGVVSKRYLEQDKLKCQRLLGPKFRKVKTSFVIHIQQVSNTLMPSGGVSGYTPVG